MCFAIRYPLNVTENRKMRVFKDLDRTATFEARSLHTAQRPSVNLTYLQVMDRPMKLTRS